MKKFYLLLFILLFCLFTSVCSAESIALKEAYRQLKILFPDKTEFENNRENLLKYLNTLQSDGFKAFSWILFERLFKDSTEKNQALYLLTYLNKNAEVPAQDTMPLALALAYNYNYSVANAEVKDLLLKDLLEHYKLYRKINRWQKKNMRFAQLENLPVIAQTYWASRDRSAYETFKLEDYSKRLVSIKHLERLHELLISEPDIKGSNVYEVSDSINRWYRPKRLKDEQMTEVLKGYAAGPLLDYQEKNALFPSENCVTDATHLSALMQSIGLAPLSFYQNFRSAGAKEGINHEWPGVYDPEQKKWITVQKANPWPSFTKKEVPVDFEIFRPIWHHIWVKEGRALEKTIGKSRLAPHAHIGRAFRMNSYGERTDNGSMRSFVFAGINEKTMDFIWTYPVWMKSEDGKLTRKK